MIITAYKQRQDISPDTQECIKIELSDEDIVRIGKRYLELQNSVIFKVPYSAIDKDERMKINYCGADMRGEINGN